MGAWEAELTTEEKDGGSKKSGQDNMPDDAHKLAWVQLMRDTRAILVKDRPESAPMKKKCKFNGLTGKIITPSLPALRPSIAGPAAPTAEEMADVDAVISKDGCGEAMANALEANHSPQGGREGSQQPELQVSAAASRSGCGVHVGFARAPRTRQRFVCGGATLHVLRAPPRS